ncbi:energy transducer TonB [Polyangium sp. 15x6]|uniref:energy transducer TonB n=1 Tax=Polyangium sp. 15x6 TaxID=3042687 RepID=UPI00249BC9F5|nr:energy transducer TonB [Polyangium sp. 15x6]MDI3287848.1 energy transducer TonB [Polyangium sp. 15x6]
MTRPHPISGLPQLPYTPQALCNRVEGVMIVRCVITEEGAIEGCQVLKTLPYLEKEVVRTLESTRYTPVEFEGRPRRVSYTFTLRFVRR